ncbi:MAG: PAS domain-containing protein [Polyangiales bacterium]|jgi:PAS domain-containing protein
MIRLLVACLGLGLGLSTVAFAQGVGARAADASEAEDGVPEPPSEDGQDSAASSQETSSSSQEPDAPNASEAQDPPPPPPFQIAVDRFDEFEMARLAQDRANADVEAREALERARAEEAGRALMRRLEAESESARESARSAQRRQEELDAQIRNLGELFTSRPEQVEPLAPTIVVDESGVFADELDSFVQTFGTDRSYGSLFALLFGVLFAAALAGGMRRLRDGLAPKGILPTVFAFIHLAARLLVVGLVVAFVVRFLPPRMSLVLLLVFAGVALAVGWSARDLLPDLIAGIVLAFERRVRRGMWLSSKDFSGQVEHVGFRASSLRDAQGNEVSVPNRFILGAPIATDSTREREQDVTLRLTGESAEALREAITDAVLSSPWVAPNHRPLVYRDPDEPELWRVRARLLEAQYGVRFEGELLERTEATLEAIVARNTGTLKAALAEAEEPNDKDST